MGQRKGQRALTGILLLDKPYGISSNAALQRARRLYGAAKAGHTGSLDPLATGMLPICFGEATKLAGWLLESDKHYRLTARLGQQTTTGDIEGDIVAERPWQHITAEALASAITAMHGEQQQIPPMFSALKHQGQRLYELAREGVAVDRPPRTIVVHQLTLLRFERNELELEVRCSKGTYVRVLAEDLAQQLGSCAHLTALRRLSTGPFSGEMVTLDQLQALNEQGGGLDDCLLPALAALAGLPRVLLDSEARRRVMQGQPVSCEHSWPEGTRVALLAEDQQLLGIARVCPDRRLAPQRLLNEHA